MTTTHTPLAPSHWKHRRIELHWTALRLGPARQEWRCVVGLHIQDDQSALLDATLHRADDTAALLQPTNVTLQWHAPNDVLHVDVLWKNAKTAENKVILRLSVGIDGRLHYATTTLLGDAGGGIWDQPRLEMEPAAAPEESSAPKDVPHVHA